MNVRFVGAGPDDGNRWLKQSISPCSPYNSKVVLSVSLYLSLSLSLSVSVSLSLSLLRITITVRMLILMILVVILGILPSRADPASPRFLWVHLL